MLITRIWVNIDIRILFLKAPSSPTAVDMGWLNNPNLILLPIKSESCRILFLKLSWSVIFIVWLAMTKYDKIKPIQLNRFKIRHNRVVHKWKLDITTFYCLKGQKLCIFHIEHFLVRQKQLYYCYLKNEKANRFNKPWI